MGCQACAKKVAGGVPDYFCCKIVRTETSPRYRIQLEVRDDTDKSDFVLLDHLAESILGLTANKLYELNGNETEIPPVLVMNLMNKSIKVQVQVNEYNIRTTRNEFTITKILDAPKGYSVTNFSGPREKLGRITSILQLTKELCVQTWNHFIKIIDCD